MTKISAVVIAKNEENMIADCLDSLSFCDETVVVDNGSDDRTVEIAKKMGAKAFTLETSDFSKLRNFGLEKAKKEWILYVDADERVSEGLKNEITHLINDSDRFEKLNAYFLKRQNFYLGSSKKNEWPYIEKVERLFKKKFIKGWRGELHESPVINGEVGEL
ncbi:MAG: glycosyltransferase family 2 protein, partial [Patescibacteria group bacterium]